MGSVYGKCKEKGFRCTRPWKCVDIRINAEKYPTPEQQSAAMARWRAADHYDVCPDCKHFEPL